MAQKKIFFGWYVTIFAAVALFVSYGIRGSFGVFFPSMLKELGWSRTLLSGAISASLLVNAIVSPTAGNFVGRFGGKWLITLGGALIGIGVILVGQTTQVWHLFIAYGIIIAIGINCMGLVVTQSMVVGWWTRKRTFALAIAMSGITLGIAILQPVSNFLIEHYGWRTSNTIIGICVLIIIPLGAQFFAKRRPEDMGLLPDGDDPEAAAAALKAMQAGMAALAAAEPDIEYKEGLRTPNFWFLLLGNLFMGLPGFILTTHLFAYALEKGLSAGMAVSILFVSLFLGLLSGLVFGWASDKLKVLKAPLIFAILSFFVAFVILIFADSPTMFWIYAVVAGIGGGGGVVFPALVANQFGRLGMGKFYGILILAAAFGAAVGPVLAGYIYDVTQSYNWAWIICAGIQIAAAISIILVGKSPVQKKIEALAAAKASAA
jgi:MFS family permease